MTHDEIRELLRLHALWLAGASKGVRIDLRRGDLRGAVIRGADLYRADLSGADLTGCRVDARTIATTRRPLTWWLKSGAIVEE